MPELVCNGFTHEEARREAGLTGIEAYVSRLDGALVDIDLKHPIAIGVGETVAEAVARGLQASLAGKLAVKCAAEKPTVTPVQLGLVEDDRCRFYLQALTRMRGAPIIGMGEKVSGLPVVWVGSRDRWYGCVGLNTTIALRKALQAALLRVQNQSDCRATQTVEVSSVLQGKGALPRLVLPPSGGIVQPAVLREAVHVLKRNDRHLWIADMAIEPFLKELPGAVIGVVLREGVS
jgi:putative thiazole-containing bacteriocin maturation protein